MCRGFIIRVLIIIFLSLRARLIGFQTLGSKILAALHSPVEHFQFLFSYLPSGLIGLGFGVQGKLLSKLEEILKRFLGLGS